MDQNPYAPPTAPVADAPTTGLKKRSVVLMILLSLLTLGLYNPLWYLRRRAALNQLDSRKKLPKWPFEVALVWWAAQIAIAVARQLGASERFAGAPSAIVMLIRLAVAILMLMQAFATKEIIEDHFANPADEDASMASYTRVELSGILTFFFQIFYLQYSINRHLDSAPADA